MRTEADCAEEAWASVVGAAADAITNSTMGTTAAIHFGYFFLCEISFQKNGNKEKPKRARKIPSSILSVPAMLSPPIRKIIPNSQRSTFPTVPNFFICSSFCVHSAII